MGRQIGGWHGLPGELRPASSLLPHELDAVYHADFGPHVSYTSAAPLAWR